MAGPTPTCSAIVSHTAAFLAELVADPLLRRHLLSAAAAAGGGQQHPAATLQALSLVSDALDTAASCSPSPSSLRAAERLLRSLPAATPLSCLLLALARAARRGAGAAAAVLDLFALDPALARHELAPAAFEALFAPRLLPVMRHFAARRAAAAARTKGEEGGSDEATPMRVLSLMSGAQAQEMRALEREYDKVLDANCRAYALYLKRILEAGEPSSPAVSSPLPQPLPPPELVFGVEDDDDSRGDEDTAPENDESAASSQSELRDNPMWAETEEQPGDLYPRRQGSVKGRRDLLRPPSLYPQRVPPHLIVQQQQALPEKIAASPLSSKQPRPRADAGQLSPEPASFPVRCDAAAVDPLQPLPTPKDFVCPITSQVFDDPVTLETGQTYERRAIQEWLDRGNATCPITRQRLHGAQLPKTNYVLKRLIGAWRDQRRTPSPSSSPSPSPPPATPPPAPATAMAGDSPAPPFPLPVKAAAASSPSPDANTSASAPSPTSVIAQASLESAVAELRAAVSCLCTSEDLAQSERSVLKIERLWRDATAGGADAEPAILAALARPAVLNGFVEILFNSVSAQVLRVAVFLLAELASRDDAVVQTLTRVDSDVDCLAALFKKGLAEAAVLICLLSPAPEQLVEMDLAEALVATIRRGGGDEDPLKMCVSPKAASVILLSQILVEDAAAAADDDSSSTPPVPRSALMSERFIRSLAASLEAEPVEERLAAMRILLRCIWEDGHCRRSIAEKASLGAVLDAFHAVGDADKIDIVRFLYELLKLKKRSAAERLLRTIKEGGSFSMMHTLLVYLQSAPPEHSPVVAGLLLQLDLLVEPRKISMYREEALDCLIQCLKNADFPRCQLLAAETIMCLPGRFSSSGRPLARSTLLKLARVKERYRQSQDLSAARADGEDEMEEGKAASEWERKAAYAVVSHEFGLVFEALSECLRTKNAELFTTSLVCAAWLVHMLSLLPDTGVLGAARVCLLRQFVVVLRSAKHGSDRVLAMVALRSFMNDRGRFFFLLLLLLLLHVSELNLGMCKFVEGMHDITTYIKDVLRTLRELKKSSGLAFEMLKLLSDGQESSVDMWSHKEINQEHSKAITSLSVLHSESEEKLYSGSLDRSIRAWQLRDGVLRCVEVHDTRDPVQSLAVASAVACFVPQGAGVKVLSWGSGSSRVVNANKYVRSMALVHGKLFCGCSDGSVQEIDLASGTLGVIQPGSKRILGKASPVYALQAHGGLLYTGGTPSSSSAASADGGGGAAVKVWSCANYGLVGSMATAAEARSLVVSADLVYVASRAAAVEIWSREKLARIGTLQAGGRVQCMAVDADGDVLVVGTSDGKIQVRPVQRIYYFLHCIELGTE
ncbi:Transducin/WD40 repeat-like superfamily protein [Zea mays]|uniref:RING-type E3 ubiquitin transferase n=1 Tax=Zea mays TaxID=4577 RepID=A0A1D6MF38_MAIZE|nr:Transducin/WD40 repeat-like superfamily protein [Zea mays]